MINMDKHDFYRTSENYNFSSSRSDSRRVFIMILDGAGIGALPDAESYGDGEAATLPGVSRQVGGLEIPTLQKLGLGNIITLTGVPPAFPPQAAYGCMAMKSPGKDTTTGHWELAGTVLPYPFPLYPQGFPPEVMEKFKEAIGREVLGNKTASGTEIINELGDEHLQTGCPIVYTSADSVFQIAAHEDIVPVDILYYWCSKAREILCHKHAVCRVIARPFTGSSGDYKRTPRRRDYSLEPPRPTLLDLLAADGLEVTLVGKVRDIFNGRGVTRYIPVEGGNEAVAEGFGEALNVTQNGLIWGTFGDFDTLYGHRNDAEGFAKAMGEFDSFLREFLTRVHEKNDLIIITADHGCDPTWPGTDHTREYVPLLVYGGGISQQLNDGDKSEGSCCFGDSAGIYLGSRETMADVGASVMEFLGVENHGEIAGSSFLELLF